MLVAFRDSYDVAIVGGGPAGLSAALVLGRAVRKVLVLDHGQKRNAPSKEAHGVFTRDGTPAQKLLEIARRQLKPYNVVLAEEEVIDIQMENNSFKLITTTGLTPTSRKVILCTGIKDLLPDIPGIKNYWGKSVVHCPYCHGWELRNKPIAALVNPHTILNFASLLYGWTDDLVLLTNGTVQIDEAILEKINHKGIPLIQKEINQLCGTGNQLEIIRFQDGDHLEREALFIHPHQKLRSEFVNNMDLERNSEGKINTNRYGETNIPGIYAAGDAGPNMQQITIAASTGAEIGIAINHKLAEEDFNSIHKT